MAERQRARRQEETRVPVIIPVRRDVEDRQISQIRGGLERVVVEIRDLQRYAESITVPPTGKTASGIEADAQRLERTISRMRLSSIPVLGERFSDETALVQSRIRSARSEAQAGRLGSATSEIERARQILVNLGRVFEIELSILQGGYPEGFEIPGVVDEMDELQDALESAFLDLGTENNARGVFLINLFQHYANNQQTYNLDNETARQERDALLRTGIERSQDARAGRRYTAEQAAADQQLLQRFVSNLIQMRSQVHAQNMQILTDWRTEIQQLLRQEDLSDTNRRQYTELRHEVERVLRRLRASQEVRSDEMLALTRRYLLLTGREMPRSYTERRNEVERTARELRGSARRVAPQTQQWFAQQALDLLGEGNMQLANIAVAMALLERNSGREGARAHISDSRYREISSVIERRSVMTPSERSRVAHDIQVASMSAEISELSSRFSAMRVASAQQPRRQRVMLAAEAARTRLRSGDVAGARRLLDMASQYSDLLIDKRWQTFAGRNEMETAIDAEITGGDYSHEFSVAVGIYRMGVEADRFRSAISDWRGRGITAHKRVVEQGLASVQRLAREGHAEEARQVLVMLAMYTDAVERLGVRRRGAITSLSEEDAGRVRGMERAIEGASAMRARVDTIVTQDLFMQSYNASMAVYVDRMSDALSSLASSRRSGQAAITRAIETARGRAANNDFRGALTLLEYVRDFYGRSGSGRTEGWRYRLYTGADTRGFAGYRAGRRQMLEAIRMEVDAGSEAAHMAAAQRMDAGTRTLASTEMLLGANQAVMDRFMGATPFVEGEADTTGRIGLGTRSGGRYPQYLDLIDVRSYEGLHTTDAALSGPTLDTLRIRMRTAAESGNVAAYRSASAAFETRFQLVASRTQRARTITTARQQIRELERLTGGSRPEMAQLYANADGVLESDTAGARRRISRLESRRAALETRLAGLENSTGEFPMEEYSRLLTDIGREGRVARTYALVTGQLRMNETYRQMVAANGGGFIRSRTLEDLAAERTDLENCQRILLNSPTPAAMRMAEANYRSAMHFRASACGWYRAENALTLRDSESWTRGISEGAEFFYDVIVGGRSFDEAAGRVGPSTGPTARDEFQFLQDMHTEAFHTILFGADTQAEADQASRLLSATRMVEVSHLGIPADNASQVFNNFIPDQQYMREQAQLAIQEFRAGHAQEGTRILARIETRYDGMSTRAADAQWWGNAALIGTGLAVSLVPGGGWLVGGAIFTTMAFDQVMTEIAVDGEASAASWGILALTIGTMGLAGAAAITRSLAVVGTGAEATIYSTRLLAVSRALAYTGLGVGIGFAGYLGYESYEAFARGDTRNGILLAGMALFPLAHMAGARTLSAARGARGRALARAQLESAIEDIVPARSQPEVRIETNEAPSTQAVREAVGGPRRLFRFLQRYIGADAQARAAMVRSFPEAVRVRIESLSNHAAIRASVEAGEISQFAMQALRQGVRDFALPPRGPGGGGPRGTRAQTDSAGLLTVDGIRSFLRDLMIPDGGLEPALNQRAAARARLEQIRAEHPEVAARIDRVLSHSDYAHVRRALNFERMTPEAQRSLEGVQSYIRSRLPEPPVEAEAAAVRAQYRQAVGYDGPLVIEQGGTATGEPVGMARPGPRASAGSGRGGGTVTPGRVTTDAPASSGGARGGGRTPPSGPDVVASPEEAAAAAAARGQAEVALVRRGLVERGLRGIADRVRSWRETRQARRAPAEAPSDEAIMDSASRRMTDALELINPPEQVRAAREAATARAQQLEAEVARLEESGASRARIDQARQVADAARADAAATENLLTNMPQRMTRLFGDLYNMARARGRAGEGFRRLLVRLYADPNLRPYLEQAAAQPGEQGALMNRALQLARHSVTRAAGSQRTADAFLGREARRPLTREEMGLVVRAIETSAAQRVARANAAIDQSAVRLERAQRAAADANARLAAERSGRARPRRIASLERAAEAANTAHEQAFEAHQHLLGEARQTLTPNRPLAQTESLLGFELTPGERATMVLQLESSGVIEGHVVMTESQLLGGRVERLIRQTRPGQDPVAEAIRRGVLERVAQGGDLDAILREVVQSDRVLRAVRDNWNPQMRRIFEQAAQSGQIDNIINGGTPAGELLGSLRTPAIRGGMQALGLYEPRVTQLMNSLGEEAVILAGESDVSVRQMIRARAAGVGRWLWQHEPFAHWGALSYARAVRAHPSGFRTWPAIRNAPRMLPQLAAWGAMLYGGWRWGYQPIYNALSDADDIQAGLAVVNRDFGVTLSEDNAAWIIQDPNGREFYYHMPNSLPTSSARRPRNQSEFQEQLERNGFFVDPYQLDAFLSDGRAMAGRLERINELLETRRTSSGADRTEAERELLEIVRPWGMDLDAIDAHLARPQRTASRTELTITDLADLRVPDWQRRGVVTTFSSAVATQLLVDSGAISVRELRSGRIGTRGREMVQFLSTNPDVFAYLWQEMQEGHIPVTYMDEAIRHLTSEGNMSSYRALATGSRSLPSILTERLTAEHIYLPTAIMQNSFLGALDRRAAADPSSARTFGRVLRTYRDNPAALTAFNQFNLTEGDFGEEIYGDPAALAALIAENPSTALATARQRGMVASRMFGEMDSSLRSGEYGAIIAFAVSHSTMRSGRPNGGVMKWMDENSHQIRNLREILADIAGNAQAANMTPQEIYDYLDRQSGRYRSRGWWSGDTPIEIRERAPSARRSGGSAPVRSATPRRTGDASRRQVLEDETAPRYPRRPGFETRARAAPAEAQDEAAPTTQPAQPVLGLSQEATTFYESEERGGVQLSRIIDATIDRMFNDSEGQDGALMAQVYGNSADGRARALQEIKAEIYRMLTSTSERDAGLRSTNGLSVSGSGASLRVEVNARRARALRNHIYGFVRTRRRQ